MRTPEVARESVIELALNLEPIRPYRERMTVTQIPVRLDVEALAPTVYKAVVHLDRAATRQLDDADLDQRLRELVRIRASQLNGCAYCVDMHTKDARAIGETEQRLYALPSGARRRSSRAASARR